MVVTRYFPLGLLALACQSQPPAQAPAPAPPRASTAPVIVDAPEETGAVEKGDAITQAVNAPDRSEADRTLDAGRKVDELMRFFEIQPGQTVADLGAGTGTTTELLARIVGPQGKVYAQNSKFILERFAEKGLSDRLQKPVMKNVVRVDREFADPLPDDAKNLDAVVNVLFYHDTFWMDVDRAAMNKDIFQALKPGGLYLIVDHSAKAGRGAQDVKTLHRVEESVVRGEIEKAGFVFVESADFLRTPGDTRDWNASPSAAGDKRGTSDRFVLKFKKPE